jgi:hypothetical protein
MADCAKCLASVYVPDGYDWDEGYATAQAEYLYRCIEETIRHDLRDEIGFLTVFDTALRAVLEIVDMPDRRASLLIRMILQNKGKISKGKRASFPEVTDLEIERIERVVWSTWLHAQNPEALTNAE